jgi:hypothetical protein
MSATFREYTDAKNCSIVAFCSLLVFFILVFTEFGIYISISALAFYLVFNLVWLHTAYSTFARETSQNSIHPKKVLINNFIPFVCFYSPYYNIIELLNFANQNTIPAYFNWFLQIISLIFAVIQAFGDQDFRFFYFTAFVWLGFALYLYHGVNGKIQSLVV